MLQIYNLIVLVLYCTLKILSWSISKIFLMKKKILLDNLIYKIQTFNIKKYSLYKSSDNVGVLWNNILTF